MSTATTMGCGGVKEEVSRARRAMVEADAFLVSRDIVDGFKLLVSWELRLWTR